MKKQTNNQKDVVEGVVHIATPSLSEKELEDDKINHREIIKRLIEIEKKEDDFMEITLNYVKYLEEQLKFYDIGYNKALEEVEKKFDENFKFQEFNSIAEIERRFVRFKQQLTQMEEKGK